MNANFHIFFSLLHRMIMMMSGKFFDHFFLMNHSWKSMTLRIFFCNIKSLRTLKPKCLYSKWMQTFTIFFFLFHRMMMTMSGKVSVVDFIVFGVTLVVPVAIALYYSCVKKQKTTSAVFLADRTLSALPISFSLAVSYLSAVTITGEIFYTIVICHHQ